MEGKIVYQNANYPSIGIAEMIKSNAALKKFVHWCLIPKYQARPRRWVKLFVNPFFHKKGKGSLICRRSRVDVLPFQPFTIGNYSTIEDFSTINNGVGAVYIGNNCRVGLGSVIIGPVTIGNNVLLAQNIIMSGLNHTYQNINIPICEQGTTMDIIVIEDDCWIGANAVITAGVTIGKHSIVGAGSVVTKSIAPYSIAVGNPAKIIKQYNLITKNWEKNSD